MLGYGTNLICNYLSNLFFAPNPTYEYKNQLLTINSNGLPGFFGSHPALIA